MAWQDRPYYRDESSFNVKFGFTPPSRMALGVMIACFVVFILQAFTSDVGGGGFGGSPYGPLTYWCGLTFQDYKAFTQPWRWITYQYLHSGAMHIFFNLL